PLFSTQMNGRSALVSGVGEIVGERYMITEPSAQRRFLQDLSWYSPLLMEALVDVAVEVVAQPGTIAEAADLLALSARLQAPVTLRGAGTGNYGQSVPLEGGLLIDTRRLNRVVALEDRSVTVEAGCVFDDVID